MVLQVFARVLNVEQFMISKSKGILINKEEYKNLISLRHADWVFIEVLGSVGIIIITTRVLP